MLAQGLSRCVKHLCPMNTAALRGRDAFQQAKRLRAAAREPSSLASDDAYSRQRRRGGRIIIRATRRRRPALREFTAGAYGCRMGVPICSVRSLVGLSDKIRISDASPCVSAGMKKV